MARLAAALGLALAVTGCATPAAEPLQSAETFDWCRQPITFSPPPARWDREGDNGGGMLGVRFVLRGGGGQCISVAAYGSLAERDQSAGLRRLAGRRDSLEQREFLHELALLRPRTDDPLSDREAETARAVNEALDHATADELAGQPGFVRTDLEAAAAAAASYEMTLPEILPRVRLLEHDDAALGIRWRLGYQRDTVISGRPVFASDDTLITPERPLLYHEVFWVVNGCAFRATFQGVAQNLPLFHRVVDSIGFPDVARVPR